uniref:Uncharacterized protein n=1 Tax=Rhizophora mucronata TaxID=61149 RepID=A0A2P2QPJ9_RHIMU
MVKWLFHGRPKAQNPVIFWLGVTVGPRFLLKLRLLIETAS